ncbi:T6SS immunity protein Tli4 family protein [Quatrionicoccus australiensis]|uniref:T6SS immunity protein Tli4 family protein n=1 Tax=Quatrionicoccus australiensis TaxID=138118 RepID=UPI001CFBADC1|nr:T6SS immunity protein Tli4 family protein [Quatrionicoccus australiensis]MCB4359530.1 hypothetical protein [Quatrionicoccus australiensis]
MRRKYLALLASIICGSAGCSETAPPEWPKECVGRLQLALPGEADQGAYLFKDLIVDREKYGGWASTVFFDGQHDGWTAFSISHITHPLTHPEKQLVAREFQKIVDRATKFHKSKVVFLPVNKQHGQAWAVTNRDIGLDVIVNDSVFLWGNATSSDTEFVLAKEKLNRLINGLRPRTLFDVPSEPGLCLPYVFIPDGGQEKHAIAMTYRLKEHPDITVNLKSETAKATPKAGADIRQDSVTNDFRTDTFWGTVTAPGNLKSARSIWHLPARQSIQLAGCPGQETFLAVVRNDSAEEDYIYLSVARGNPDAPEAAPDIRFFVEQQRENAIKRGITPLTQDEVLKLARQIAASVGPRQGK